MALTGDNDPAKRQMLERVVHWTLNGQAQPPFLCTPEALEDLAAGFLLTSGRVKAYSQICSISFSQDSLAVQLSGEPAPPHYIDMRLSLTAPLKSDLRITVDMLRQCADRLTGEESYYGTHRIMLHGPLGEITREDIGRHNAADKVIGEAARLGWDLSRCAMGATGRISLEILAKAAMVGIPIIFSKKYPSDLSCAYASRLGIGIAAKIQSAQPVLSGTVWRFMQV